MENLKIDVKDRKILLELQKNSKASYSTIGKSVGLPKTVVAYRINKLKESGLLSLFCTVISKTRLNYIQARLFLKLHNYNEEIENKLLEFLKNKKGIHWVATLNGCYDFSIIFLSKDLIEMNNTYQEIIYKFSKYILDKDLSIPLQTYYFPLRYVFEEKDKIISSTIKKKKHTLTKLDIDIINLIKQDSRKQILEISETLNISTQTVTKRIKDLEKSGIIGAYRIRIDHKLLGFHHFHTFLTLSNINEKKEKEIIEFISNITSTMHIIKATGKYDLEFESILKNHFQLHDIISRIKNRFSENIQKEESCLIYKIHNINTVKYEL